VHPRFSNGLHRSSLLSVIDWSIPLSAFMHRLRFATTTSSKIPCVRITSFPWNGIWRCDEVTNAQPSFALTCGQLQYSWPGSPLLDHVVSCTERLLDIIVTSVLFNTKNLVIVFAFRFFEFALGFKCFILDTRLQQIGLSHCFPLSNNFLPVTRIWPRHLAWTPAKSTWCRFVVGGFGLAELMMVG